MARITALGVYQVRQLPAKAVHAKRIDPWGYTRGLHQGPLGC
jgi:hypothetical protein